MVVFTTIVFTIVVFTTLSGATTDSTTAPSDNSNWHCAIYPPISTVLSATDGVQQSPLQKNELGLEVMVLYLTFNNISVISWRSVLFVEETGVPGENHRPVAGHWQTLSQNVSSTPRMRGIRTHNISGDVYWLHRKL